MQAEQIYEWTKRSFSETRRAVAALDSRLADAALRRFLQPPWAAEAERRRTSRAQRSGDSRSMPLYKRTACT